MISALTLYGDYSVVLTGLAQFDSNGYLEILDFETQSDAVSLASSAFSPSSETPSLESYLGLLSPNDMTIGYDVEEGEHTDVKTYYVINSSTAYEPVVLSFESEEDALLRKGVTSYSGEEIEGLRTKYGFLSGSNYLMMESSSIDSIAGIMKEERVNNPYYPRITNDPIGLQDVTSFRMEETPQTASVATGSYTGSYSSAVLGVPDSSGIIGMGY